MNKTLTIAAAMIMVAASCNKNYNSVPAFESGTEQESATFTVNVLGTATKAESSILTHLDNERAMETNFQIITYDVKKDGAGYDYTSSVSTWYNVETVGTQTSFTTTLLPGRKKVLFLCNQAKMSPGVVPDWVHRNTLVTDTRDAFTSTHLPLGLGFTSDYDLEVTAGTKIERSVALLHMCSRIALKSIIDETNDDRIESLRGKSISLLNVPNGLKMDGHVKETPYYNPKEGDYSTAEKCAASTALGAGPRSFYALTYTGNNLNPGYLYTYPGTSVRMLVALDIKLSTESTVKTYYYSIPITGLDFNKTYDVVLRVRNLGSTDPANPAIPTSASFTISVASWTAADEIDEMM